MTEAAGGYDRADEDLAPGRRTARGVLPRLSVMMFLELFIWGAWLPLIAGYLGQMNFTPSQQAWILSTFPLAAFVGLFFSNQFADRNFSAERFLGASHLIGGLALLCVPLTQSFWPVFTLMLVHCLCYVPTLSITNSIAFAHLTDPKREFGLIRVWGTIGWIAAAWPCVFFLVDWTRTPALHSTTLVHWLGAALATSKTGLAAHDATRYIFFAAGAAALALAAFSLFLPHTPPKPASAAREDLAWLEAVKLLRLPFIAVLFAVTFLDAAVLQSYFLLTGDFLQRIGIPSNWVTPAMSVSQIAEIVAMSALGLVLKRLGWRKTMILGILGHVVRFAIFALAPAPWLAVAINLVHGICYAFFFATVYIFVDEFFPKDARASAQGLFNFLILGLGPFVSNFVTVQMEQDFRAGTGPDYRTIFLVLAGVSLVGALILLLLFHPPVSSRESAEVGAFEPVNRIGQPATSP